MPAPKTVRDLVPLFLAWCDAHRAPATARFYRLGLRVLSLELADRPLEDLRQHEIEAVLTKAGTRPDGTPFAPDTLRRNAISFQAFQKWLRKNRYLKKSIVRNLEKPPGRKRERIPTDDEIARIVAIAPADWLRIFAGLRMCGARPNELCRATLADWDRNAGKIVLAHHKTAKKTGKPRVIPVGVQFAELLDQSTAGRDDGPLFLRDDGRPWDPQTVSSIYRRLRDRLGLPRELCLYLTRHEHGTKLLAAVKDLKAVGDALGHADIKTTQRYVHKTTEELRGNQDLLHFETAPKPAASDKPLDDAPRAA